MHRLHTLALGLLLAASASFTSCNTAKPYLFGYRPAPHYQPVATAPAATSAIVAEAPNVAPTAPNTDLLTASAEATVVAARPSVVSSPAPALSARLETARTEQQLTRSQERRYERVISKVKRAEAKQAATGSKVDAVELILAIFLPPIGVLVHEHGINSKFWISLLLTLLFFFPGMIYSILVVTDTI